MVPLNKALLTPYSLGGVALGGVARIPLMTDNLQDAYRVEPTPFAWIGIQDQRSPAASHALEKQRRVTKRPLMFLQEQRSSVGKNG